MIGLENETVSGNITGESNADNGSRKKQKINAFDILKKSAQIKGDRKTEIEVPKNKKNEVVVKKVNQDFFKKRVTKVQNELADVVELPNESKIPSTQCSDPIVIGDNNAVEDDGSPAIQETHQLRRSKRTTNQLKSFFPQEDPLFILDANDPDYSNQKQVLSKNKKSRTIKNSFFMTKEEKREQSIIERTAKLQLKVQLSKEITNEMCRGKAVNPFFNARVNKVSNKSHGLMGPLVEAPWPSDDIIHVGRSIYSPSISIDFPKWIPTPIQVPEIFSFNHYSDISEPKYKMDFTENQVIDIESDDKYLQYAIETFEKDKMTRKLSDDLWTNHWYQSESKVEKSVIAGLRSWLKDWMPLHGLAGIIKSKKSAKLDDFINDCSESEEEEIKRSPMAIILGPSGSGKTSIVYYIAEILGYEIIELNASQDRSSKQLSCIFSSGNSNQMLSTEKKLLILLDDVDILLDSEKGFFQSLPTLLTSTQHPVIVTSTDYPIKESNSNIPTLLHDIANLSPVFELAAMDNVNISQILALCAYEHGYSLHDAVINDQIQMNIHQSLLQLQFFCQGIGLPPKELYIEVTKCCENENNQSIGIDAEIRSKLDVKLFIENDHLFGEELNLETLGIVTKDVQKDQEGLCISQFEQTDTIELRKFREGVFSLFSPAWSRLGKSTDSEYAPYLNLICRFDVMFGDPSANKRTRAVTQRQINLTRKSRRFRFIEEDMEEKFGSPWFDQL